MVGVLVISLLVVIINIDSAYVEHALIYAVKVVVVPDIQIREQWRVAKKLTDTAIEIVILQRDGHDFLQATDLVRNCALHAIMTYVQIGQARHVINLIRESAFDFIM